MTAGHGPENELISAPLPAKPRFVDLEKCSLAGLTVMLSKSPIYSGSRCPENMFSETPVLPGEMVSPQANCYNVP